MKQSMYTFFFEEPEEYIGYSWLSNQYFSYPLKDKEDVERIMKNPDDVLTNTDSEIYKNLSDNLFLIPDSFDEYNHLIALHRKAIYSTDKMSFTIMPTMACNLRCTYCYESHPSLKDSKISETVLQNLKNEIAVRINSLETLNIAWFGGEPLYMVDVVEDFNKYCQKLCDENNVKFISGMSTNALLLNEKNIKKVSAANIKKLQITIDGFKEHHDVNRITERNQGTFDMVFANMINFVKYDKNNQVALRVHFPRDMDEEFLEKTISTMEMIDEEVRDQISVYPHVLFTSCTDKWGNPSKDNKIKEVKIKPNNSKQILDDFRRRVFELGFPSPDLFRNKYYCEADLDGYWTVRPDGYMTKCTIAVEKERAQARITEKGIKPIGNLAADFKLKEASGSLMESCKLCKYLPLCWRGCAFGIKEKDSILDFMNSHCLNIESNWLMKRKLDNIKHRFLKSKTGE